MLPPALAHRPIGDRITLGLHSITNEVEREREVGG
jgi:hypothetical protein